MALEGNRGALACMELMVDKGIHREDRTFQSAILWLCLVGEERQRWAD